ncbi:MAG: hypothetical protein ACR2FY_25335 [Pirellulaceae bacterium]
MPRISWLTSAALVAVLLLSRRALCEQPVHPYDGIQAGYDAYQLGEEQRQQNIGQQVYLNDRMRAWTTPLATYGYGYGPYLSTYGWAPASRDYAYAYGNSPERYYPGYGSRYADRPLTVFEPWPYVPGDIWGGFYTPPLRQPVAQVQSQTGPNRWESHPVYNPPLYSYSVLPPVNSPAPKSSPRPPAVERPSVPEPPSPGPSTDDEPARPRRRVF